MDQPSKLSEVKAERGGTEGLLILTLLGAVGPTSSGPRTRMTLRDSGSSLRAVSRSSLRTLSRLLERWEVCYSGARSSNLERDINGTEKGPKNVRHVDQ